MATFLTAAQMALVAGFALTASPADACELNYAWTCKPVPSVEPAETAEPAANAKPLQINARRRAAAPKQAQANERTTRKEKRAAHKAAARRHIVRSRQARSDESVADAARAEEVEVAPAMPRRRPAAAGPRLAAAGPRLAAAASRPVDAGAESNSGFMAAWSERTGTPAEAARPAPGATAPVMTAPAMPTSAVTVASAGPIAASAVQASQPVPAPAVPIRVAAQNEVNELDLAAAESSAAPAESSWLRSLFLAFGGLIAVGSALRLFL